MPIGAICVREVVVADKSTSIQETARLMRQFHVGSVVVVESIGSRPVPVGMVTDRDIVLSMVAPGLDAAEFTLGDLVLRDVVTCPEDQGVFECVQRLRMHGVRRAPVVDRNGMLVGIVAVDDLIQLLAEELQALGTLVSRELAAEVECRPTPFQALNTYEETELVGALV
jgi:CBS domain-containing protein